MFLKPSERCLARQWTSAAADPDLMFDWSARAFCVWPKRAAADLVHRLSLVSAHLSLPHAGGSRRSSAQPPQSTVELVHNRAFASAETGADGALLESDATEQNTSGVESSAPSPLLTSQRLSETEAEEGARELGSGPPGVDQRALAALPARLVSTRERYESGATTISSLLSGVGSYQNLI